MAPKRTSGSMRSLIQATGLFLAVLLVGSLPHASEAFSASNAGDAAPERIERSGVADVESVTIAFHVPDPDESSCERTSDRCEMEAPDDCSMVHGCGSGACPWSALPAIQEPALEISLSTQPGTLGDLTLPIHAPPPRLV